MTVDAPEPLGTIVVGGSLGGLFTAAVLRSIGWEVDIYERSPRDMDGRGGGVVLQPDVVALVERVGASIDRGLGVPSRDRVAYHLDGSILSRDFAPQVQTSWSLVYRVMLGHFETSRYHRGKTLVDIHREDGTITAVFEDGTAATGAILVGADGGGSTVRSIVAPNSTPRYAGYVAWRGLIPEEDVPDEARELLGHFAFADGAGSHILGYLVPGGHDAVAVGRRMYNRVWYRIVDEAAELPDIMPGADGTRYGYSVPPGKLAQRWRDHVYREAEELLPPQFRAVVRATPEPFAQAILDLTSPRMVYDRVVLVGDAAFIPRPHTAASTAKAAVNALALGEALKDAKRTDEIDRALKIWEPAQLRLGRYLYRTGSDVGNRLMFRSID